MQHPTEWLLNFYVPAENLLISCNLYKIKRRHVMGRPAATILGRAPLPVRRVTAAMRPCKDFDSFLSRPVEVLQSFLFKSWNALTFRDFSLPLQNWVCTWFKLLVSWLGWLETWRISLLLLFQSFVKPQKARKIWSVMKALLRKLNRETNSQLVSKLLKQTCRWAWWAKCSMSKLLALSISSGKIFQDDSFSFAC